MVAEISFLGEVNDFLAPGNRGRTIRYPLDRRASIKDIIEALGPPHTEVGSIRLGDREIGFDHVVEDGDILTVSPLTPPVDVTRPTLLRPTPLPRLVFLVDVNVAQLAMLLRLLGLDAAYDRTWRDETLADMAAAEGRVVLTRDRSLLKRRSIEHGRLVRAVAPDLQLVEVVHVYGITGPFHPFSRCVRCNVELEAVPKAQVLDRLQPLTRKYFDTFHICPRCQRIYWPGSHHERMRDRLKNLGLDQE